MLFTGPSAASLPCSRASGTRVLSHELHHVCGEGAGAGGPEPSTREASRAFGRLLHLMDPAALVPAQPRDLRGRGQSRERKPGLSETRIVSEKGRSIVGLVHFCSVNLSCVGCWGWCG